MYDYFTKKPGFCQNVLNVDAGAGNFVLNNVANVLNKVKNAANIVN